MVWDLGDIVKLPNVTLRPTTELGMTKTAMLGNWPYTLGGKTGLPQTNHAIIIYSLQAHFVSMIVLPET